MSIEFPNFFKDGENKKELQKIIDKTLYPEGLTDVNRYEQLEKEINEIEEYLREDISPADGEWFSKLQLMKDNLDLQKEVIKNELNNLITANKNPKTLTVFTELLQKEKSIDHEIKEIEDKLFERPVEQVSKEDKIFLDQKKELLLQEYLKLSEIVESMREALDEKAKRN